MSKNVTSEPTSCFSPLCPWSICSPAVLLLGVFCHAWMFLPVNPPVRRVFAQIRPFSKAVFICMPVVVASGFRAGGKQTTQSAYMLFAPWAAGSPHVRSHFCLMMCLLWCLYRNNLIPGRLCVLGALEAMQRKHLGGSKVCSMAFTSSKPNRKRGDMLISLLKCTQEF